MNRLSQTVALVGLAVIFMGTWGARLERCPGRSPDWRVLGATERDGCQYHAAWRVAAGEIGLASDVNRPLPRSSDESGWKWGDDWGQ